MHKSNFNGENKFKNCFSEPVRRKALQTIISDFALHKSNFQIYSFTRNKFAKELSWCSIVQIDSLLRYVSSMLKWNIRSLCWNPSNSYTKIVFMFDLLAWLLKEINSRVPLWYIKFQSFLAKVQSHGSCPRWPRMRKTICCRTRTLPRDSTRNTSRKKF